MPKPNLSRDLRTRLGLTESEWAHALGVSLRTVERWEDRSNSPSGLALEVMRGLASALDSGTVDKRQAGQIVVLGVGTLIRDAIIARTRDWS